MKDASMPVTLWRVMLRSKLTVFALATLVLYTLVALASAFGWIASNWKMEVGEAYQAPSWQHWLGTDILGRSVLAKVIKGTEVAMSIGCVVALLAITIGVLLGAWAGYYGGIVDQCIVWVYTTLLAVPTILLLIALTLILGKGLYSVYLSLAITSWVDVSRLVRGEVIRHKHKEYVQAAAAIGASHFRTLFMHILPNILPIIIVQLSLLFQLAIKSEVVLSYLGLGIQNSPSWGMMINDAKVELLRGVWWQLVFATGAMFWVVLAFNIVGDALRDALDPKIKGR